MEPAAVFLSAWRFRAAFLVALLAAACADVRTYPREHAACLERLQRDAEHLLPGFEALGYRPALVQFQLDEDMRGVRGFRKADDVMGDALPSGLIRIRPSRVCGNPDIGRAVVAHEMAHVALQHKGVPDTGLVLEWEGAPRQEKEADALALRVLRKTGGPLAAEHFVACRQLTECNPATTGSGGPPAFRRPPQ